MMIRLPQRVFMPKVQLAATAVQTRQPADAPPRKPAGVEPLAPAPQSQITLIQPQYPLNMPPPPLSAVVPSAMVWNDPKPKAAPRRAIVPGPTQREMPIAEMRVPSSDIRSGARIVDVPESIRANAAVLPVAQLAPTPINEKQLVGAPEVHPVAMLSVSDAQLTSDTIVVPPGNVIPSAARAERSRTAMRPGGGNSDAGKNPAIAQPDVRASTSPMRSVAPSVVTSASVHSPATPLAASSTGGQREIIHPPNGRFDIVVIQSSPDESLPAGVLSGKPVYTVYLQVGDSKPWVMHFSAANSSTVQRGGFVQLPDPRPLIAPYPRVTVRPDEPVDGPGPYVLVRGMVDESGSLQNLQVIGAIQSSKSSLLDALSRWRFQPARRAELPQTVEMVLAIPIHNARSDM
jgi:hypothetical protein